MLQITITTDQKVVARIEPRSNSGNPLAFEGIAEWGILAGEGTVEAADDGLSAELVSSDTPGNTIYMVTIDADVGLGVEEVSGLILVSSIDPNGIGMIASAPVPKTPLLK